MPKNDEYLNLKEYLTMKKYPTLEEYVGTSMWKECLTTKEYQNIPEYIPHHEGVPYHEKVPHPEWACISAKLSIEEAQFTIKKYVHNLKGVTAIVCLYSFKIKSLYCIYKLRS